ncbi:hypothetical protein HPP92_011621 [Vanilla planifolia]|uniref:Uncharacterized protein n=1 Tax=Vanilla planifolia TaxID=51239 RepID=A0A835RCQ2_VANPL|nr:hypothetical protein HPP92_011621 [Vanilla planifolia]
MVTKARERQLRRMSNAVKGAVGEELRNRVMGHKGDENTGKLGRISQLSLKQNFIREEKLRPLMKETLRRDSSELVRTRKF